MGYSLLDLRIAVVKLESTPGTAETLADADHNVRLFGIECAPIFEIDDENSKFATGDHGEDESIVGAQSGTISFSCKLAYGGAVTTLPNWFKLFKACGYEEMTYTSTGVGLQPISGKDCITATIGVYDINRCSTPAAVCYLFSGCSGTVEFGCEGIGKPLVAKFTFTGKLVSIADVANGDIPVLTSPDTELAEKLLNTTVTFGGTAQKISSFNLTAGNEIQPVIDQSENTGYLAYGIATRKPRFSMNPLVQLVATDNVYSKILNETTGAIALELQNIKINIPVAQLISTTLANREGLVNWDQNYKCLRNGSSSSDLYDEATHDILIGEYSS
jgi:hypothetical protein